MEVSLIAGAKEENFDGFAASYEATSRMNIIEE